MCKPSALLDKYDAHYQDANHDIDIVIQNFSINKQSFKLKFIIDEISFVGTNFSDFELEDENDFKKANETFQMQKYGGNTLWEHRLKYYYALQKYSLSVKLPINLINLHTHLPETGYLIFENLLTEKINNPLISGYFCDNERVPIDEVHCKKFQLITENWVYSAYKPSPYFETSLIQIINECKSQYSLKCCFTCQYSDYSPFGYDYFGSMLCHKHHSDIYLTVNNKSDYLDKIDESECDLQQETNLCPFFEERTKCQGYRWFIE